MTITLKMNPHTGDLALPGETYHYNGGGYRVRKDVHDAMGFRIHRAWRDDILGYDNTPLRRPTKSFKEIVTLDIQYKKTGSRGVCRDYLAKWLIRDSGPEVDVMRAIMDQCSFVPETYIHYISEPRRYQQMLWCCENLSGNIDQLLPEYIPREKPTVSVLDNIRSVISYELPR